TFLFPGQLGPFTFTPQGNSTTVGITIDGIAFDPLTSSIVSTWEATISTQYVGSPGAPIGPDQVIAGALNNTLPNNTWSGTFVARASSAIRERTSVVLLGCGLCGVGRRARGG